MHMNSIVLLLRNPSLILRYRVLKDLLMRPADDSELLELDTLRFQDKLYLTLLNLQEKDGSWRAIESRQNVHPVYATAQALIRLSFWGFGPDNPAVQRGVEYLFSQQNEDGSWDSNAGGENTEVREGYDMIPLQTAFPLRSVSSAGYAQDPRSERAYAWLLQQQMDDGAWPTGIASEVYGYVAGYRRLPHSRWGCRSNTTGALICLANHPEYRVSNAAHRGLDLLLGKIAKEVNNLGFEACRMAGINSFHGFLTLYAAFDPAQILELCAQMGAGEPDSRVKTLVNLISSQKQSDGMWSYPQKPQSAPWVTFSILQSLKRISKGEHWFPSEPTTPFHEYPQPKRRF